MCVCVCDAENQVLFRNRMQSDRRGKAGGMLFSHVHFKRVLLVITRAFFTGQGFRVKTGMSGRGKRLYELLRFGCAFLCWGTVSQTG